MMAIVIEATSSNAISHEISFTLQSLSQSIMREFCIFKTCKESQNHWAERNTPLIVRREMYEFAFAFYIQKLISFPSKPVIYLVSNLKILFLKKEIS